MGFWSGFAEGFVQAVNGERSYGRIDRLCEQLGWSVDERDGDTVGLNFKCPVVGRRTVYINSGDEPLVLFAALSSVALSEQHADFAIGYALFSNANARMGRWQASFSRREDIIFTLTYTALGNGLDAAALKYICTTMSAEASNFDVKMREKGYLR